MRTTPKTTTWRVAVTAVAALGAMAGCGGEDDGIADIVEAAANGEQLSADDIAAVESAAEQMAEDQRPDVVLPDPCTLLTPEEAQATVQEPVGVVGPEDVGVDAQECAFVGVSGGAGFPPSIFVRATADCGGPCRPTADQDRQVTGLGSDGFINDALSMISWTRDGVIYQVQILFPGMVTPSDEQLTTVAHQVDDANVAVG